MVANGYDVAVLQHHVSSSGGGLTNQYSQARVSYYGIGGIPSTFFDGVLNVLGGSTNTYNQFVQKYNQRKAIPSKFNVFINGTNTGLNYTVVLTLENVDPYSGSNLVAHLAAHESGLTYGGSTYNHVTRLFVPNASGTPVSFSVNPVQTVTLNFSMSSAWNLNNCEFIAFIQDNNSKEILQAAKVNVLDLAPLDLLPPTNVTASVVCTDVDLTWSMPAGTTPDSWNVYRNGAFIANVNQMSYNDPQVLPDNQYSYSVTAVYSGDESVPANSQLINVDYPDNIIPENFNAVAEYNGVHLTWNQPSGCLNTLGYNIYRNGVKINDNPVTETQYLDGDVLQDVYEYYITAVYYFGESGETDKLYIEVDNTSAFNLKVFLEGPFSGSEMITNLNSQNYLPTVQPYNVAPWNYKGYEVLPASPASNIVDWVLVELRLSAGDVSTATPDSTIDIRAGLLLKNGNITGTDGISPIRLAAVPGNLYVVVWHRNHPGIISKNPVSGFNGVYNYDFSTGINQVYKGEYVMKDMGNGIWAVASGDGSSDIKIDNTDKNDIWVEQFGSTGYLNGDFNLDGVVDDTDKIYYWNINSGKNGFVPGGVRSGWTGPFYCGNPLVDERDGNIYQTVRIGFQCWMSENLKATVYKNGTPIPHIVDNSQWNALTTGAYVWYNHDPDMGDKYGAIYNWFTVIDTNGLCPEGWHVPSDSERSTLTDFAGGTGTPHGNELKSCRQVSSPLSGECNTTEHPRWDADFVDYGTDVYGFSGLPGGYRSNDGSFGFIGQYALWWTSDETTAGLAKTYYLSYDNGIVTTGSLNKKYGFSVRCIKD